MSKTVSVARGKSGGVFFRRNLVVIAIAILWAAAHQPDHLDDASLVIWPLEMVTVALLARACLAIIEPAARLAINLALRGVRPAPPPEDRA